MSELEAKLNRILQEHQRESGLNMIGGRSRLVERLTAFCEELLQEAAAHTDEQVERHPTAGAA